MKIENLKRRYKVRRSLLDFLQLLSEDWFLEKKSPQKVTYLRGQHHAQPATNVHTWSRAFVTLVWFSVQVAILALWSKYFSQQGS
jgi:hypothetical protein